MGLYVAALFTGVSNGDDWHASHWSLGLGLGLAAPSVIMPRS
jgi:hypothetical protein